jgi:hypothetical protein
LLTFSPKEAVSKQGILGFKSGLMQRFESFKLSSGADILAPCSGAVLATFYKYWVTFLQSSGHTGIDPCPAEL